MSLLRFRYRHANGRFQLLYWYFLIASAATCEAYAAAAPATVSNAQQSVTAIVFRARPQTSGEFWPALFQALSSELEAGETPEGVVLDKRPALFRGVDDAQGFTFSQIISVQLIGRCDGWPQLQPSTVMGPLGWVLRISGSIQPYIFIDCGSLAQVLQAKIASMDCADRRQAMAQAIARVLVHEWVHIATQSSRHSRRGISQACLSAEELIAAPGSNPGSSLKR